MFINYTNVFIKEESRYKLHDRHTATTTQLSTVKK